MGKIEPYKFCLTIKSKLKIVIFKNILSQQIVIIVINSTEAKRFKNTYNKMESGIEGVPGSLTEISEVRRFHRCKTFGNTDIPKFFCKVL